MLEEEGKFYNEVYSKIFGLANDARLCEEKVKRMAFVEIRFPESSFLSIGKVPSFSLSGSIANIGK